MCGVWPAALTAGLAFAVPQFLVSNLHGPCWWTSYLPFLHDSNAVLLRFWHLEKNGNSSEAADAQGDRRRNKELAAAWTPLDPFEFAAVLLGLAFISNTRPTILRSAFRFPDCISGSSGLTHRSRKRGSGTSSVHMELGSQLPERQSWCRGIGPHHYGVLLQRPLFRICRAASFGGYSLLTIAAMLALGYVTRYSGNDATLGLALAQTGTFYPFFGTLAGWLGVALTGSDTASNFLFGSLQTIAAKRAGLSPVLMAAQTAPAELWARWIDAQSIVVARHGTNWYGHEGSILRYVFFHSLAGNPHGNPGYASWPTHSLSSRLVVHNKKRKAYFFDFCRKAEPGVLFLLKSLVRPSGKSHLHLCDGCVNSNQLGYCRYHARNASDALQPGIEYWHDDGSLHHPSRSQRRLAALHRLATNR